MSNPIVAVFNYNGYKLFRLTANNINDTIASGGGLNGDYNYDGALISAVNSITPSSNPDSQGNPFCYTSSVGGLSICVKELQYIGPAITCIFNDSTNPGNTYTVSAVPCDSDLDYNTFAVTYTAP